ncbi:hypothetical protein LS482_03000 [Sinomicrobium kalidii]|uniref:hypothetical protein n=1 Tax=Sinomicrobium kalidii TaxID=2900738 RepID=UPI001E6309CD|nr:hypothetical protein [Sinomicrobium kalidii]UGU18340.1 hypothetical protein LS482_03000 [Sinomicrobium kalidii]
MTFNGTRALGRTNTGTVRTGKRVGFVILNGILLSLRKPKRFLKKASGMILKKYWNGPTANSGQIEKIRILFMETVNPLRLFFRKRSYGTVIPYGIPLHTIHHKNGFFIGINL